MAKSIFKGVGKVLGIGGKKKAASTPAPAPTEQKGPVVTQLSGDLAEDAYRRTGRRRSSRSSSSSRDRFALPTILSEKLGS